jgi:hypothetical protein
VVVDGGGGDGVLVKSSVRFVLAATSRRPDGSGGRVSSSSVRNLVA